MGQLLLVDGDVRTMDPRRPRAQAVAVRGNTIVAVGSTKEVLSWRERGARVVRLEGRTVVPGLIDAHLHLLGYALARGRLRLEGLSKELVLRGVADTARRRPSGVWILGRGWNHNEWEPKVLPHRRDLDLVAPRHPVSLISHDGHAVWASSRALQAAGIDRERRDPPGGRIARDAKGEPTGVLLEDAVQLVFQKVPAPTPHARREAVAAIVPHLHSLGITSVHVIEAEDSVATLQAMHADGALPLRVTFFLPIEGLKAVLRNRVKSGHGDERFRIGGVKLFADGTLSSRTAALLAPFEGTKDPGMLLRTEREIGKVVRSANAAGLAVIVHAIGDRAVRVALDAFERSLRHAQRGNLRNRVEHAELIDARDIPRFQRLGVIASMQPNQIFADIATAERLWGRRRSARAFPFRSLWESGAIVAFGSDAPVEDIAPLPGVFAAVARTRMNGTPRGGWNAREALTAEEAVWAHTMGGAYASHEEDRKGSITPGKLADLVVLSRDIFAGAPRHILDARVELTVFDGEVVFEG